MSLAEIFAVRNVESLGYRAALFGVILRFAVSVEHRLVTDGWTDTRRQPIPALASVVARAWLVMTDVRDARSGQPAGVRRAAVYRVSGRLRRALVPRTTHRQTLRSVHTKYT